MRETAWRCGAFIMWIIVFTTVYIL